MENNIAPFIHLIFIGFIALFPVINPFGSAFMVSQYLSNLTEKKRNSSVRQIAWNAFLICLITLLIGQWILKLFGISVPIVQFAGGIMICKIGWDFLSPKKSENVSEDSNEKIDNLQDNDIDNKLFFPITFPITTGAGVIAVIFTLSSHTSNENMTQYLTNTLAILFSVVLNCILILICYINSSKFINYLGSQKEKIINNIMAFLIFCVGLQIAFDGITSLFKL